MKKHDYVNLKMGFIEQYSMIIKKKELPHWKKSGWLEYKEIGLPRGNEKASLMYGELKERTETLIFNKPLLFKDTAQKTIIGKSVTKVSTSLGNYGMGGPGFFGLLLDDTEFIVYAVWSADNYVFVDDIIVGCHWSFYDRTKPWISNISSVAWDNLTDYIYGSVIVDYVLKEDTFKLILKKDDKNIEVNFLRNDDRIPRKAGRFRNAYKQGTIDEFIVFQHKEATLIV